MSNKATMGETGKPQKATQPAVIAIAYKRTLGDRTPEFYSHLGHTLCASVSPFVQWILYFIPRVPLIAYKMLPDSNGLWK